MGFINKLFSGGASEVVNSLGQVLDKVVTTKGEKMQLELEMKRADQQFIRDMAGLTLEEKKSYLGDIADARRRDTDVQSNPHATPLSKNVSPILALGGTLLCFSLFAWLMFGAWHPEDANKKDIVLYVLGVLSGLLTQIYSYYFGSSQGSNTKTEIINTMKGSR